VRIDEAEREGFALVLSVVGWSLLCEERERDSLVISCPSDLCFVLLGLFFFFNTSTMNVFPPFRDDLDLERKPHVFGSRTF